MQVFYCIGYICVLAMAIPFFVLAGETVGWWQLSALFRDFLAHVFAYGLLFSFLGGMAIAIARER